MPCTVKLTVEEVAADEGVVQARELLMITYAVCVPVARLLVT